MWYFREVYYMDLNLKRYGGVTTVSCGGIIIGELYKVNLIMMEISIMETVIITVATIIKMEMTIVTMIIIWVVIMATILR